MEFYLRLAQTMIAPTALLSTTNGLHGLLTQPFGKLGLPPWMIQGIGLWKAMIVTLNFLHEGEYIPLAQSMLAMLMGGAIFSHIEVERSVLKALPAFAVLATAVAVPILRGAPSPVTSGCVSLVLATMGYAVGTAIQAALQTPPPPKRSD